VGDFNTPLSTIDKLSRQRVNKEILELNYTRDIMEVTDICRVFHPATAQHIVFSAAHGTFPKIDHILRQKASLDKCKKIEITPFKLSYNDAIKLELNNKTRSRKYSTTGG
jgi:hypothetical protein